MSFKHVLQAAAELQARVPDAVLVGGTAAAIHASHRVSFDDDHVLTDLTERFDQILEALESSDGWITARVQRPVLVLGSLDGVETGIRQLIRARPLELEIATVGEQQIRVPTHAEMLRVKAWLTLTRNATRDYLDVAALASTIERPAQVLSRLDDYYVDQIGPGGSRIATQVAKQLAEPKPYDLASVDLANYRGLVERWQSWDDVSDYLGELAVEVLEC